ncbi:hypothetical protein BOTBODRAFT_471987 [Botryobasidium botryosum FD-172 SS1]|uniref:Uncharacterized protein n=1 Tax=Botryobasidium botryosum (strain FD-172 SS1) TaxID=930990 RepID=A0A067M890_BOTB1|nr:hypothetical protein BOTBODRAFT_471987 [Botryobasidium botryosum FD-172 SS1]
MDNFFIYVAYFRPAYRDARCHWVMWICTDPEAALGVSFDVEGSTRNWTKRSSTRHSPAMSNSYGGMVKVGDVPRDELDDVIADISTVRVDNRGENWNCQSYIMAIMRMLEINGYVYPGQSRSISQRIPQW